MTFGPPPWGDTPAEVANSRRVDGRAFVVQLAPDDFLVGGLDARVEFRRTLADGRQGQLLRVEDGRYLQGQWRADRWLNGDEVDYGINFHDQPGLVRVRVGSF